jgi:uncharacterized protein with beta-barrel porin domain
MWDVRQIWACSAAAVVLAAVMLSSIQPASAQCAPDPAVSGDTVTCTGNDADGFQAAAGVNNLAVDVQPGATVQDNGTSAIGVNDGNTVTNRGTVAAGDNATAISAFNANTVTNHGAITTGDAGVGIAIQGNNSTITSTGTVTGGAVSAGFLVDGTSNRITNAGSITVGGTVAAGIAVLGNSNTIINSGTITVGDLVSTGIATFGLTPGSNNRIINTGTINVGAGSAGIEVDNDADVFNSGTINAAGGVAIEFCNCNSASVLTIAPSSVINGAVLGTGTQLFQLGGTGTGTFDLGLIGPARQYDGFGTFNKVDSSTWTLTGNGNQDWTVLGGALRVNGTISGAVAIDAGGTLGGIGTVGDTTVNGGTLSPGNSIGTLTVQGNLALSSAATYLVELDPASADRTLVTGTASLSGTVQAAFASGTYLQRSYTILTANGGVSGTFAVLDTSSMPAGLSARLTYDPNNVYLNLTAALGTGVGLNQNQQNVATSVNTFFNGGGLLPQRFGALFALSGRSLLSALTQVSGEIATQSSQAAFNSVDYFLNLMLDPFVISRGGDMASGGGPGANQYASDEAEAGAYAAKRTQRSQGEQDAYAAVAYKAAARSNLLDRRWSLWGAAYGGELKADGNAAVGSRDASTRAFGFAAGADYRLSPDTLVGFAMSGGGTTFALAQAGGSGRSDVFQAGAFARHNVGNGYIKGAVAYGWHDVTTERAVAIAGIDRLEAKFNAHSLGARAEGGYRFGTTWMGVTPYAAAQAITYFLPGYGEQVEAGLSTFALNYAERDVTTARTELGMRTDKSFAWQDALVTLRARAAWAHYFDDNRSLTASFQSLPGASFVVTGAAPARDAALLSASADVRWTNGFSIAGVFEGELSGQTRGYAGKGVVRYQW